MIWSFVCDLSGARYVFKEVPGQPTLGPRTSNDSPTLS